MAESTGIEWCDHTFNAVVGCTKVSPACDNCYAETWAKRTGQSRLWSGERRRTSAAYWREPLKWNRKAADAGIRRRVFCCSLADVFDNQWEDTWRTDLFDLIQNCESLDFLLLTKRPQNIAKMLPPDWGDGWPNVWLGTTVENQAEADRRIPHLLSARARVHFLSAEPLLGPVRLTHIDHDRDRGWVEPMDALRPYTLQQAREDWGDDCGQTSDRPAIKWVIAGGESGPHARPCHPDWIRSLRDQCLAAGVPFFFKQWGEWHPTSGVDVYCHGPNRNAREFPQSPGISWLRDGRICRRDFSVPEHAQRIRAGLAYNSRAVEVDETALRAFHDYVERRSQSDPGLEWMYRVGKKRAGALLDGREWREFPA